MAQGGIGGVSDKEKQLISRFREHWCEILLMMVRSANVRDSVLLTKTLPHFQPVNKAIQI